MSSFDEREKAFEAKYRNDEELRFKVNNRRNKLLGLWAAELFDLTGEAANVYASEVVASDFDRPGDEDVLEKVLADFEARGVEMSGHRLRRRMDELLTEAQRQIAADMS